MPSRAHQILLPQTVQVYELPPSQLLFLFSFFPHKSNLRYVRQNAFHLLYSGMSKTHYWTSHDVCATLQAFSLLPGHRSRLCPVHTKMLAFWNRLAATSIYGSNSSSNTTPWRRRRTRGSQYCINILWSRKRMDTWLKIQYIYIYSEAEQLLIQLIYSIKFNNSTVSEMLKSKINIFHC